MTFEPTITHQMLEIATLLTGHASFDPAWDFEAFVRSVPARWVVYLFCDQDEQPIQLLCVKNLRASLKRRLGGEEQIGPSRRVDYRDVVRHIRWQRVDSAFEADWLYYEVARRIFPKTYQGMVGFRPAWFIHVDPENNFPRYIKTTDLARSGLYVGPIEDKHAAARLIQLVEDSFDLCRYYNILVEAPHAKACAYKEMGKCPAPCDGSISMDHYRQMIRESIGALLDPAESIRTRTRHMQQAAAELRFEAAATIKAHVDQLSRLGNGPFRYARRLGDFQFLSLQQGPKSGAAKTFLITPERIDPQSCLIDEPANASELLRVALLKASNKEPKIDEAATERIGIVAHHLFSPKARQGVFLRLHDADEKSLLKAYRELRQRPVEQETDAEGVMKELQSL